MILNGQALVVNGWMDQMRPRTINIIFISYFLEEEKVEEVVGMLSKFFFVIVVCLVAFCP